MAYAVRADILEQIAQFTISTTSKPTEAQVDLMMADTDNELDVCLSAAGVAVPVTAPAEFLAWLGRLSSWGTTAMVLKSMFPDARGAGETPAYAFWEKRYQGGLKGIKDGVFIPPGVSTSGARQDPTTYFIRNPDAEEDLGDISEPLFKMGRVF